MLACSEARGGLDVIGQAGNTKNDSVRGFFGAERGAGGQTAVAKRARQTQEASQGADAVLPFRRKPGKRTILRARFGSAMVTDRKSEQFPIFVAPPGRNGQTKKELASRFLRRLAGLHVADAVQASRSKQNAVMSRVAECGC